MCLVGDSRQITFSCVCVLCVYVCVCDKLIIIVHFTVTHTSAVHKLVSQAAAHCPSRAPPRSSSRLPRDANASTRHIRTHEHTPVRVRERAIDRERRVTNNQGRGAHQHKFRECFHHRVACTHTTHTHTHKRTHTSARLPCILWCDREV